MSLPGVQATVSSAESPYPLLRPSDHCAAWRLCALAPALQRVGSPAERVVPVYLGAAPASSAGIIGAVCEVANSVDDRKDDKAAVGFSRSPLVPVR